MARRAERTMIAEGTKEKLDGDAVKKCLKWIDKKKWEKACE